MKRLIRFLKGYEKESFLAPLFKMLEATFELIVPLVVANIMDIGIKNQDNAYIWHQCQRLGRCSTCDLGSLQHRVSPSRANRGACGSEDSRDLPVLQPRAVQDR